MGGDVNAAALIATAIVWVLLFAFVLFAEWALDRLTGMVGEPRGLRARKMPPPSGPCSTRATRPGRPPRGGTTPT